MTEKDMFIIIQNIFATEILEEIFLLSFSVPFNYSRNSAPSLLCSKPGVPKKRTIKRTIMGSVNICVAAKAD